jgi:2-keto-4-pentenoate hydratase/2-oxohepta-3-ene-1,7-dioic acid hydratase in catechol pathway
MRLATYTTNSPPRLGVVRDDQIIDVVALPGFVDITSMLSLIDQGKEGVARLQQALADTNDTALQAQNALHPLAEVHLLAPIPHPRKNIMCLGRNYADHAAEHGSSAPTTPIFFTKATTSVSGPYDSIVLDRAITSRLDWEVELGVILGRKGKNIPAAEALDYVFGYTVIDDVSARDLQFGRKRRQ